MINCRTCPYCKRVSVSNLYDKLECSKTGAEIEPTGHKTAKTKDKCPLVKREVQNQHGAQGSKKETGKKENSNG